jgi:hypothetical protein
VFSLVCFLNGTVCVMCMCLRIVCTVNLNERDCQDMGWRCVTGGSGNSGLLWRTCDEISGSTKCGEW